MLPFFLSFILGKVLQYTNNKQMLLKVNNPFINWGLPVVMAAAAAATTDDD